MAWVRRWDLTPWLAFLLSLGVLLASLALERLCDRLLEEYSRLQEARAGRMAWSRLPPEDQEGEVVLPDAGLPRREGAPIPAREAELADLVLAGEKPGEGWLEGMGSPGGEVVMPEPAEKAARAPPVPREAPPRADPVAPRGGFQDRGKFVLGPGPDEEPRPASAAPWVVEGVLVAGNLLLVSLALRGRQEKVARA